MDQSTLSRIMANYPDFWFPQSWEDRGSGGGFSGARIIKIRTELGDFCLRGWPKHGPPVARILALHKLLRFLSAEGLKPIACPVLTHHKNTLVEFQTRQWHLEPWLPGTADFHKNPSASRLTACMQALATWHRLAARFRCDSLSVTWFQQEKAGTSPAVRERLQLIQKYRWKLSSYGDAISNPAIPSHVRELCREFLSQFQMHSEKIQAELTSALTLQVPLQPCLRDIWHDHVLFTGDQLTGLIDPSACRTESVAADLSRLLGSLLQDQFSRWELALRDYSTLRPLSVTERNLIPILDRSGVLLSGMTWISRFHGPASKFLEWDSISKRLEWITARSEKLNLQYREHY